MSELSAKRKTAIQNDIISCDVEIKTRRTFIVILDEVKRIERDLIASATRRKKTFRDLIKCHLEKKTSLPKRKSRRTNTKKFAGASADNTCLICGNGGDVTTPCECKCICTSCYKKKKALLTGTRRHVRCPGCDKAINSIRVTN